MSNVVLYCWCPMKVHQFFCILHVYELCLLCELGVDLLIEINEFLEHIELVIFVSNNFDIYSRYIYKFPIPFDRRL